MYMLQALTVAALLFPPQTTLDVCHVCKKITERVSDSSSYPCSISHWERWSGPPYKFQFCSNLCHHLVTNVKLIYHGREPSLLDEGSLPWIPTPLKHYYMSYPCNHDHMTKPHKSPIKLTHTQLLHVNTLCLIPMLLSRSLDMGFNCLLCAVVY